MAMSHTARRSLSRASAVAVTLGCALLACAESEDPSPDAIEHGAPAAERDASTERADHFQTTDAQARAALDALTPEVIESDAEARQEATPDATGPLDSVTPAADAEPEARVVIPGSPCEGVLSEPCYEGPLGTSGVGLCSPGVRSCVDGLWGSCEGQVLPAVEAIALGLEVCTNGVDDDCDGLTDEDLDEDGDGFGACSLDCCDADDHGCGGIAAHVSPAAFDLPNNGIDDDCDGVIDGGGESSCSEAAINAGIDADDLVRAMDLCRFVEEGALGWGVLEASLSLADGSGAPEDIQLHVSEGLGGLIPPLANQTMAVLSSGIARGVGDEGFEDSNTHNAKTKSSPPQSYIDVHGALQTSPGCEAGSMTVRDSVRLRIRLRAPTNVHGLGFRFRFFSHEYPNYLCTKYNDFMLVLMEGASPALPEDGNISFDASGNPISVNNAFFTTCEAIACYDSSVYPIQFGPDADNDGCVDVLTCNDASNLCEGPFGACPDGAEDIAAFTTDVGYAGATSWLTTQVPVVPGEELTLDFHIWDTSDSALDSLVLLDSFQWIYQSGIGLSTHQ